MSVATLLGTPDATGLFRRAIAQSGGVAEASLEAGARTTEMVTEELGAGNDIDVLRTAPVEQIVTAQNVIATAVMIGGRLPFVPVVDGAVLPHPALDAIATGSSSGIDLLTGTNREETTYFEIGDRGAFSLDREGLFRRLNPYLGRSVAHRAVEVYEKARADRGLPTSPSDLWFALQSDYVFRVPCTRLLDAHRRHGRAYAYLFTWPSPAFGGILGSCHALELAFVFGHLELPGIDTFIGAGDDVAKLSTRMQDAWLAFAQTGDPASGDLRPWPVYGEQRTTMLLGAVCATDDAPLEPERAFWQACFAPGVAG
jgi:para-nitrobenzyl esterase